MAMNIPWKPLVIGGAAAGAAGYGTKVYCDSKTYADDPKNNMKRYAPAGACLVLGALVAKKSLPAAVALAGAGVVIGIAAYEGWGPFSPSGGPNDSTSTTPNIAQTNPAPALGSPQPNVYDPTQQQTQQTDPAQTQQTDPAQPGIAQSNPSTTATPNGSDLTDPQGGRTLGDPQNNTPTDGGYARRRTDAGYARRQGFFTNRG